MGLMDMAENLISKMKWYDLSLLKGGVFFSTLFLVGIWPAFREIALSISPYWYLAGFVIVSIPLLNSIMNPILQEFTEFS